MRIHHICLQLAGAGLLVVCCGCASIFTSGDRTIPINSNPGAATVTVYDTANKVVATGTTPAQIRLKKGAGYFKGADYRLVVEKTGYQRREFEIKHNLNGWYFGIS